MAHVCDHNVAVLPISRQGSALPDCGQYAGELFYNTSNATLYSWGGTAWVPIAATGTEDTFSFTVTDGVIGQEVSDGDTLILDDGETVKFSVVATNTVTAEAYISTDPDNALAKGSDSGLFVPVPADEIVTSLTALTGQAPEDAEIGIDISTGDLYYVNNAGNWQPVLVQQDEVEAASGALSGGANAGLKLGVDVATGDLYYVNSNGDWTAVPSTTGTPIAEELTVTGTNSISNLSQTPADLDAIQIFVNGEAFDNLGNSGIDVDANGNVTVTPGTVGYDIETTDRVTALYYA